MARKTSDDQINATLASISHEVDIVTVDNPLATIRGEKSEAIRSLRDDPLAAMHARRQIDDAQFHAGRTWQEHYENSAIGSVCAIDPTKEAVDGGRFPDLLGERQRDASKALARAREALGWQGMTIVEGLLAPKGREAPRTVQEYAMGLGMTTEREFKYIGRRFRECLETLAKLWGYA